MLTSEELSSAELKLTLMDTNVPVGWAKKCKCYSCFHFKPENEFSHSQIKKKNYICKHCVKIADVLTTYGVTREEYYDLCKTSNGEINTYGQYIGRGFCNSCGKWCNLKLDHNHDNGKVRGLLCHSCNSGAGQVGDDVIKLIAIANYLNRTDNLGYEEFVMSRKCN